MFSHSIDIQASAERIYRNYADLSSWSQWDPAVRAVSLPGGLAPGSSGWLQAAGAPRTSIRVREASAARSFTVESKLPGCRVLFGHTLQAGPQGVQATHSLSFAGPMAFFYERLLGARIAATLPAALQGLKSMSESDARA
jgi:hypothetical protein